MKLNYNGPSFRSLTWSWTTLWFLLHHSSRKNSKLYYPRIKMESTTHTERRLLRFQSFVYSGLSFDGENHRHLRWMEQWIRIIIIWERSLAKMNHRSNQDAFIFMVHFLIYWQDLSLLVPMDLPVRNEYSRNRTMVGWIGMMRIGSAEFLTRFSWPWNEPWTIFNKSVEKNKQVLAGLGGYEVSLFPSGVGFIPTVRVRRPPF
mmetsp:Transcript_26087/g.47315  ORF Transcript_26087/g.47315 Transcript_26087/m.47315 type:complete len:203 (+) Transcript_26087:350-958(+)